MVLRWAGAFVAEVQVTGLVVDLHVKAMILAFVLNIDLEQLNAAAVHGKKLKGIAGFFERKVLHVAKVVKFCPYGSVQSTNVDKFQLIKSLKA